MSQGLGSQLKTTQNLALTPELKDSLAILQCSRLELEMRLQTMLSENIMLTTQQEAIIMDFSIEDDYVSYDDVPTDLDIDANWEDFDDDYAADLVDTSKCEEETWESESTSAFTDDVFAGQEAFDADWIGAVDSFETRLLDAIAFAGFSDEEFQLVQAILDHTDEHYFFTGDLLKLGRKVGMTKAEAEQVRQKLIHLDPCGIGAEGVRECLMAQIQTSSLNDTTAQNAYVLLKEYYDFLSVKPELARRRLGISEEEMRAAMKLIATFEPYPNTDKENAVAPIKPDVYVRPRMGIFYASTNEDPRFDLVIDESYASLIKQTKGDERKYLSAQLSEAKQLLIALDRRQSTLLRVTNAIVIHQQSYFTKGESALKPLLHKDIAETLELHESTVSRTVSGKYLAFEHRLIPLRDLFSQSSKSVQGEEAVSVATIKATIKSLIEAEDQKKPYSDSALEKKLQESGYDVPRRTVAKYRDECQLATARERKLQYKVAARR